MLLTTATTEADENDKLKHNTLTFNNNNSNNNAYHFIYWCVYRLFIQREKSEAFMCSFVIKIFNLLAQVKEISIVCGG